MVFTDTPSNPYGMKTFYSRSGYKNFVQKKQFLEEGFLQTLKDRFGP